MHRCDRCGEGDEREEDVEMSLGCAYCDAFVAYGTAEDAHNQVTIHMNIHHARDLATIGRMETMVEEDGGNPEMNTCPVCHKEFPKSKEGAHDFGEHIGGPCLKGMRLLLDQFGKEYDLKEKGYKL